LINNHLLALFLYKFVKFPFVNFKTLKQFLTQFDLNENNFHIWEKIKELIFHEDYNISKDRWSEPINGLCLEDYYDLLHILTKKFPNEQISLSLLIEKLQVQDNYIEELENSFKQIKSEKRSLIKEKSELNESLVNIKSENELLNEKINQLKNDVLYQKNENEQLQN
jgi:hypothetical protein